MNRRTFIASLIAGATLDPERLLWVPGRKKVFIPPPRPFPELMNYQQVWLRSLGITVSLINGEVVSWSPEECPFIGFVAPSGALLIIQRPSTTNL